MQGVSHYMRVLAAASRDLYEHTTSFHKNIYRLHVGIYRIVENFSFRTSQGLLVKEKVKLLLYLMKEIGLKLIY